MTTDVFKQGIAWLNNKKNEIDKFINSKEGFNKLTSGNNIIGDPNSVPASPFRTSTQGAYGTFASIDTKNQSEQALLDLSSNGLTTNIAGYKKAYDNLKEKRNEYLGDTTKYASGRNYNIFVNRLNDLAGIKSDQTGCKKKVSNTGFTKEDTGTTVFYNKASAMTACLGIASDKKLPYYGIGTNGDKTVYSCLTSSAAPVANSDYTLTKIGSVFQTSADATKGGLFRNGRFGVYNDLKNSVGTDSYNIQATEAPAGYACDLWNGGSVVANSVEATFGKNCSNASVLPIKVQYVRLQAQANRPDYIQISQIAVFAYINGSSVNVAPEKEVTINGASYQNYFRWGGGDRWKKIPISGELRTRNWNGDGLYIDQTVSPVLSESSPDILPHFWELNLGKEYDVYQVVYYNRGDCCQERAIGQTITLKNGSGNPIANNTFTLTNGLVQTFDVK